MDKTALYIHIPFCKQKCLYCDFPSYSGIEDKMIPYAEALAKEIDSIGDKLISTIFIGGGTPTYLSVCALLKLKDSIKKLKLADSTEFTIEGNPGTFSEEKLKIMKEMGVNRLSIGLQAVQDSLLKKLGRIHSYNDFLSSYKMARKAGFNNVNIDLMFGLPGQSLMMWEETLNKVIELKPEHISCYSLIIEDGTPFYKMYSEADLPEENIERSMYSYAKEILLKNNYIQYEISNFSKKDLECKHNLVYWNLKNYIGVGAAAHSFYNGIRYRNEANVEKYIKQMQTGNTSVVETHKNSLNDNIEEFMFLGLRKLRGISVTEFSRRFNKNIFSVYGEVINKYVDDKLLIIEGDNLFLSDRGIEISNYVMSDFILE